MHKREDDRYAPPLSVAEEADVVANVEAGRLPAWRAFVWFGTAWALFWQRAGWWFGLVLAWTILSSVLAALAELITPTLISFFPAVHDFAVVFATAGAAYAAERVGRKVRVDWRAGLVVLVRCAGALALLGLLNVVFDQLLLRVEGLLGIYVVNMRGKPSSLLSGAADWIMYWNWLFFILAYLLPNGVAPVLVVCRRAGVARAWAAGWRGVGRNAGGVALAVVLATLLGLAVRVVLGIAVALAQPKVISIAAMDTVPPVWLWRIVALADNMFGLFLMLVLYAACRDVFFEKKDE